MTKNQVLFGAAALTTVLLWCSSHSERAQAAAEPIVRIAELELDPAQLDAYKAALKEEIETSIQVEPGVVALYAVSLNEHPEQIRLFETYRDSAAYQSHLRSAHFLRYKTQHMVQSLKLLETTPIFLGSKLNR